MRGKRVRLGSFLVWGRNIPAYAGKTSENRSSTTNNAEHPRVCGENVAAYLPLTYQGGTSPRMRGKRAAYKKGGTIDRNIPAYAGKTSSSPMS